MDAKVAQEVYAKAFFQKLAAAGIEVTNEETASNLLELAQKTRLLKTAQDRRRTVDVAALAKAANASLDRIIGGDSALDSLVKVASRAQARTKARVAAKAK